MGAMLMAQLRDAPPRENVRRMLRSELLTDEDFDAFCIDYFPAVANRLSSGLSRVQKENLLLQMISPTLISQKLQRVNVEPGTSSRVKTLIIVGLIAILGTSAILYKYIYSRNNPSSERLPREGGGNQLETLPAPVAAAAPTVSPSSHAASLGPAAPGPADTKPADTKQSVTKPAASKPRAAQPASPAARPGPVQINRVQGNHGNVTIIQNNN